MSANVLWERTAKSGQTPVLSQLGTPIGTLALPLLAAKLAPPVLSSAHVPRSRLLARLNPAPSARMAFVVAPPGSGKSVLVNQWCQQQTGPVAWLSLDAEDNDPTCFLFSVCAALGNVVPGAVARVRSLLQSPPAVTSASALTLLLKGIGTPSQCVTLVLDDYHAIGVRAVHDLVALLIEYLPPNLFLILIDRGDPPLPFLQLRHQGQLIEIRSADLRFTHEESTRFLNGCRGLSLAPEAMARLAERTEGWIAGLQMAAISLQGVADPSGFLDAFTGTHCHLVDYLFKELLQRQPPEVQSFLGRTAFLDRLCGPLCDAVTETRGGQAMLEHLEKANLFLAPLDRERRWYRYEPFFANVLRAWSLSTIREPRAALHARAAAWYEKESRTGTRRPTLPGPQPC